MTQARPEFLVAAQDYIPGVRKDLAAAIDSDDPAYLLVEAKSAIFALEQIEKLLRVGYWRPPNDLPPPRLYVLDVLRIGLGVFFLHLAGLAIPRHPKTRRGMTMIASGIDDFTWQINNDHD